MEVILVLLIIIVLTLFYIVFLINKNKNSNKTEDAACNSATQQTSESVSNSTSKKSSSPPQIKHHRKKTSSRKTSKMKWHNKMLDISMIPKNVELDKDTLLPQAIKREYGYGRRFNAFVTYENDFFYHRSTCPNIKNCRHRTIHRYVALQRNLPCPICTPVSIIDEWYFEFLKINFGATTSDSEFISHFLLSTSKLPDNSVVANITENDTLSSKN